MGKQRRMTVQAVENRHADDKLHSSRAPVQRLLEELDKSLAALNERIAELENDGHQGHALKVLKINAMDLARQIDELRCLLVHVPKLNQPFTA
jgi:hypothetical protein